jgi:NAD(P)H-nitrite reductase large subunit
VRQGVVVDDHMRTSDPHIFAAGDCAEHRGVTYGLWPTAVEQGEVAADNATGGDKSYTGYVPVTVLKVVGIELTSIGRIEPEPEDETIVLEEPDEDRYRKLVMDGDRVVGAILLGYSQEASLVTTAVKQRVDVSSLLPSLRAGDWSVLETVAGEAPAPVAPAPV